MRTLHPASIALRSLSRSVNLGFLFFLVGVFASPGGAATDVFGIVLFVVAGAAVAVGYEVAYYRRFRYALTPDTFDVTSGVLARRNREVPLRRVQNVDVRQNVLQRALGLAAVHVESAGGGRTEVSLRFVSESEAARLRRALRRDAATADPDATTARGTDAADATSQDATPPEAMSQDATPREAMSNDDTSRRLGTADAVDVPADASDVSSSDGTATADDESGHRARSADAAVDPRATDRPARSERFDRRGERGREEPVPELLFEIRPRELAILSAFTIDPGASLLATVGLSFASGFEPTTVVPVDALEGGLPGTGLVSLGWLLLVFLAVAWLLSAALTVNRYYGFRLLRVGDELAYERGLFQRYSGTIPLDKVQTLTIGESVPFRWFGYASLAIETAGYAPGQGERGSESAIPLADRDRVLGLARSVEPFEDARLRPIPERARERYAIRYAALALATIVAAYVVASRTAVDRWYLSAAVLAAAPIAAHLKWRSRGYRAGERHFFARTGVWRRTTKVVPYYRVQAVIDSRTIFQRRRRLASVTADTASSASLLGRAATAHDVDAERARVLCAQLDERLRERLLARKRERADARHSGNAPNDPPDGDSGTSGR